MIRWLLAGCVALGLGVLAAAFMLGVQAKPPVTVGLTLLITALGAVQIRWQLANARDARSDRLVSRSFPSFAIRRIDFRYAAHVVRFWTAFGYCCVGVIGIFAPTVPMPPQLPFLDLAEDWALLLTIVLSEVAFTVLSAWDFYRRRREAEVDAEDLQAALNGFDRRVAPPR